MSKSIQKCRSFDMKHFDEIYEIAADGYGIVTASQAREAGVTTGEMSRWCADGKLVRRGRGVYKVARWVPTPLVDPRSASVATPKRVRRKLPDWVKVVPAPKGASTTFFLRGHTLPARRRRHQGVRGVHYGRTPCGSGETRAEGLVTSGEYENLMKELQ